MFVDHDHDHVAISAPTEKVAFGFELTSQQEAIRQAVRELAHRELAPVAEAVRKGLFPGEGLRKLGDMGALGMVVPYLFGGSAYFAGRGADTLTFVLSVEELARICPAVALLLVNHTLATLAIVMGGNARLKANCLPELAKGELLATLVDGGSGASGLEARRYGEEYLVSGSWAPVLAGGEADIYVTSVSHGSREGSWLLVEKGAAGLSWQREGELAGMGGVAPTKAIYKECSVPRGNLLGEEGAYGQLAVPIRGLGALGMAGAALGMAEAAMAEAFHHRKGAGHDLDVQLAVAEMDVALSAARTLLLGAVFARDKAPLTPPVDCLKAKVFATQVAAATMAKVYPQGEDDIHLGAQTAGDLFLSNEEAKRIIGHGLLAHQHAE
ncbi:MAG: acyl-CoA dehydrogenase family protein [Chloroflexi bacterium]|nr:acyl-CoA dehydrogenase family protein [Chloroflexota bacterium]